MDLTQRFTKNKGIIFREEEDGAFLFDPDTCNLKFMNRSAREAFLMLNGQQDVSEVIHRVLELYPDAHAEQIRKDIEVFLKELEKERFISPHPTIRQTTST
jgi:hypothetical protein